MPSIASAFRSEVSRLSRKEVRSQIESTRKSARDQRRQIEGLKREVIDLRRRLQRLEQRTDGARAAASETAAPRARFAPAGLKAQRKRLGLSAAEYASLVGVSDQTIYNWENGATRPRPAELATLAKLRTLGKREALSRLANGAAAKAAPAGKAGRRRRRSKAA